MIHQNLALKQLQRTTRFTKFVYIDMAQLTENHEFKLTIAPPRRTNVSLGENSYKLELLEHPLKEVPFFMLSLNLFSVIFALQVMGGNRDFPDFQTTPGEEGGARL